VERGCVRRGPAAARQAISHPEETPAWNAGFIRQAGKPPGWLPDESGVPVMV